MPDDPDELADPVRWAKRMVQRERTSREVGDDERCSQCRFPWFLHPWRYDPDVRAVVRFCSAFPARPVRAVEACIAP